MQGKQDGLAYSTTTIGELVNKDTDHDGVLDWEEPLWNLDPTKKETTPGIPDGTVVAKLKQEQAGSATAGGTQDEEKLTETDKFARELFSTTSSLTQSGAMDQATAEQISSSLADKIKNSVPRKVYTMSDIKVISDNSVQAVKTYNNALINLNKKYPVKSYVADVLQKFVIDDNNVDPSVLVQLDPIIKQSQDIMNGMIKTSVPSNLAQIHLEVINAIERTIENMIDIQLFDTDPIIAMGAISKYTSNVSSLESESTTLSISIGQKLKN